MWAAQGYFARDVGAAFFLSEDRMHVTVLPFYRRIL